jgi:hypothetical protein
MHLFEALLALHDQRAAPKRWLARAVSVTSSPIGALGDCRMEEPTRVARRTLAASEVKPPSKVGNKRNNFGSGLQLLRYSDLIKSADGSYRQRRCKMKIASKVRKQVRLTLRERVAAAFAKIAGAVDSRTAQRRINDFYRSSGAAWTRSLN